MQQPEGLHRASRKALSRLISSFKPSRAEEVVERCLQELVRYYRHSGVGRRSRGIVHQMNTPLQVLSFQLELLEQNSQEELKVLPACDPNVRDRLSALRDYRSQKLHEFRLELENLQNLTRSLIKEGIHEEHEGRTYLDLNQVFRRELELYQAQHFFKHEVNKVFSFAEDLPPVYGYYIDFSQSFRNLVDNALEAMEGAASRKLLIRTSWQNRHRVVSIGDTGNGISRENLSRIFEPFFTTRGKDRAGLGLFMARRLLAPYGAVVQADSRPGETWFTVSIPVD